MRRADKRHCLSCGVHSLWSYPYAIGVAEFSGSQVNEHRFALRNMTPRCAEFGDVGVAGYICTQCYWAEGYLPLAPQPFSRLDPLT